MGPKGKAAEKAVGKPSGNLGKKPLGEPPEQSSKKPAGTPGPEDVPMPANSVMFILMCFWVFVAIMISASVITIVAMFTKFWMVKTFREPYDEPFENLTRRLAYSLSRPELENGHYSEIVSAIENLPKTIREAHLDFVAMRVKYRSLLYKVMQNSSLPWMLHGRRIYYFSKREKTWYDAENFCISRDAHLASILNNEEQNFISSHLQNTSWIGLTLEKEDDQWRWSDGSTVEKQYWSDGKPSTAKVSGIFGQSSQDCAVMVPSLNAHHWDDENCHKLYRWICKEKLDHDKP